MPSCYQFTLDIESKLTIFFHDPLKAEIDLLNLFVSERIVSFEFQMTVIYFKSYTPIFYHNSVKSWNYSSAYYLVAKLYPISLFVGIHEKS